MSLATEVLADSPLAYYQLQETGGTSATDSSGNGHTGTYEGSPTLGDTPGIPEGGTCVAFVAASSQDCKLDTLGSIGSNIATCTVEFWVRTSSTSGPQAVLGEVSTGTSTIVAVYLNTANSEVQSNGKTCFHLRDSAGHQQRMDISTNIYDGSWHHVVWVAGSNNNSTVYVDSSTQTITYNGSNAALTTFADFDFAMTLGARNVRGTYDRFADCRLAHVALYTSSLSSGRVSAHYTAGSQAAQPPSIHQPPRMPLGV